MPRRPAIALVVAAVVLLALNLRPTAVSVGPVLDDVRDGLGMSGPEAGLLTSLPVLAFAVFGALAPAAASRLGPHRVTLLALGAVTIGLAGRALAHNTALFLVLSMLALSGMAMANVLLPSLVRRHFPDRVGAMTAVYTTALAVGLTAAFVVTVPIADALGGWRAGLGVWAAVAVVAAVPWVVLAVTDDRPARSVPGTDAQARIGFGDVARTRLGWAMAVFFGVQSLEAYAVFGWFATLWRDSGFGATTAGVLLGIVAGMSIPLSLVVPNLTARPGDRRWVLIPIIACYPVAYLGLVAAPHRLAVLWAVVLGVALSTFPVILTLIGLRARTPEGTAALSGFSQSIGYLISAIGPFGVGVLHDASHGWTVPLVALTVLAAPMLALGIYVARPDTLEDQLVSRHDPHQEGGR